MEKLLVISGPTASGKTSLAFLLAKKFDGELVSADSRQVYKDMDIVTGKDVDKDIKTWLLDVAAPDTFFNVSDFYNLSWEAINDIWKRGKLPIVVGGTGFYIKALVDGIGTIGIKPDWRLRQKLESLTIDQLGEQLKELNPKRWEEMNKSDRRNPRRLIRAIEVIGKLATNNQQPTANFLWIGLTTTFPKLYERIDKRVDERLKMGAVEETKQLEKKYGWNIPSMTGQGYRQLQSYVEGNTSLEEAIKRWKFAEHLYARKQMTWFKKEKRIIWFNIADKNMVEKAERKVRQWYQ